MWLVSTKLSLITQNSNLMYPQACPFKGNLPPEYEIRYQFTVRQVGKGGKECDHSSYHSLHKIQSYVQTCSFKGNLPTDSAPVHSAASWERRRECDWYRPSCHSLPQIQSWCMHKHVYSKGLTSWVWDKVPIHSAASGEMRQRMWSSKLPLTTQNSILRANISIQR